MEIDILKKLCIVLCTTPPYMPPFAAHLGTRVMRVAAGLVALALALANAKQFCADLLAPCYLMDYPESFAEMFCDR